jgi:KH domain
MKLSDKTKEACHNIGGFYYEKNKFNVEEAYDELKLVNITKVHYDDETIVIECSRPGILIGSKGSNIEALKEYLTKAFGKEIKISIVENETMTYLTWFNIEPDDDYYEEGIDPDLKGGIS